MSNALDFARRFGESEGTFAYLGCIDRYGCRHCECRDYYVAAGEPFVHRLACPWIEARVIAGLSIERERMVFCPDCQATHERAEHDAHTADVCAAVVAERRERHLREGAEARRKHAQSRRADTIREDFVFSTAPDRVIAIDPDSADWGETAAERQATWDAYPALPEMQWEMLGVHGSWLRACSAYSEGAERECGRRAFFFIAHGHASRCFLCVPEGTQSSGKANVLAQQRFIRERQNEGATDRLARMMGVL